jgi:hypothetical protein
MTAPIDKEKIKAIFKSAITNRIKELEGEIRL